MGEMVWEIQISGYGMNKAQEKEAEHKEHSQGYYCNSDVTGQMVATRVLNKHNA